MLSDVKMSKHEMTAIIHRELAHQFTGHVIQTLYCGS